MAVNTNNSMYYVGRGGGCGDADGNDEWSDEGCEGANGKWGDGGGNDDGWGGSYVINGGGSGGRDSRTGCFKCGGNHFARDCHKPDTCRCCGNEGHISKNCPEQIEKKPRIDVYMPSETAEIDLFAYGISSGINFEKYDNIEVQCSGENVPKPIARFEEAGLCDFLMHNIRKSGYKMPTPVQKHSISCIMQKRDFMACARTGSGKTAAFLLPILHMILEDGGVSNGREIPQKPLALILTPTRELAIQIYDEARKFSLGSSVMCTVVYGGTAVKYQIANLNRGCDLLVGTPGRLLDFIERGKVSLESVKFFVLDEADRMLDKGFHSEVLKISGSAGMPSKGKRQTLMFSATYPDSVQILASDLMEDYIFLAVGIIGAACEDVKQNVLEVLKYDKREKVLDILRDVGAKRTMVFVETKKNADFLATYLSGEGVPTTSIHGDRLQRERETALKDFRTGKMPVIVATSVASRGLDIRDVAHVINYDMPKDIDEYVHRIGRTGRVGNMGKSTSFFDSQRSEDCAIAPSLVKILVQSHQHVPEFLHKYAGGRTTDARGGFGASDFRNEWY